VSVEAFRERVCFHHIAAAHGQRAVQSARRATS
jgi:hypothetical protein